MGDAVTLGHGPAVGTLEPPFFDVVTKAPNGPIRLLSSEERAALPLKC